MLNKRLLQLRELPGTGDALYCFYLFSLSCDGERKTGECGLPVQEYSTRAAFAGAAGLFCPGKEEPVTEYMEQRISVIHHDDMIFIIHSERDKSALHLVPPSVTPPNA